MLSSLDLPHIVIKMANCAWIVPLQDIQFNVPMFNESVATLELQCPNYIFVAVLPQLELSVVLSDKEEDSGSSCLDVTSFSAVKTCSWESHILLFNTPCGFGVMYLDVCE